MRTLRVACFVLSSSVARAADGASTPEIVHFHTGDLDLAGELFKPTGAGPFQRVVVHTSLRDARRLQLSADGAAAQDRLVRFELGLDGFCLRADVAAHLHFAAHGQPPDTAERTRGWSDLQPPRQRAARSSFKKAFGLLQDGRCVPYAGVSPDMKSVDG